MAPRIISAYQIPDISFGYYIVGTEASENLWGSSGGDTIYGRGGHDSLYGLGGNDTMFGEIGDDLLSGGAGNDWLFGGDGNDRLDGSKGNDIFDGGAGADEFLGGSGFDTVTYLNSATGVTVELGYRGFGGDANGDTYAGIETVIGSNHQDLLIGDANHTTLEGRAGDDVIIGGQGLDNLVGGLGADRLTGDVAGVFNIDYFVFAKSEVAPGQADTITDFQSGLDLLRLSGFSVGDLGSNGVLARVTISADGIVHEAFGATVDASDKLFFDVLDQTFYSGEVEQDANGAWHMTHKAAIVQIENSSALATQDLWFV